MLSYKLQRHSTYFLNTN